MEDISFSFFMKYSFPITEGFNLFSYLRWENVLVQKVERHGGNVRLRYSKGVFYYFCSPEDNFNNNYLISTYINLYKILPHSPSLPFSSTFL